MLAFIGTCQLTLSSEAQIIEEIKSAGQIYAYDQIHGDHEILLDFTYPTLIEKAGGRLAMKNYELNFETILVIKHTKL